MQVDSQACLRDTFFCPISWQLVTVPFIGIPTKLVIRLKYIISCACLMFSLYSRPAQLRKLEGPNYQYNFAAGRKSLFQRNYRTTITCSRWNFTTFSTIEKARAGRKNTARGSHVVQACSTRSCLRYPKTSN